ncbi:MAG: efflux RND transporter permease subunit, partial [Oceanococcaceae bacterium]
DVADVRIEDGPPMIKSENARPSGWVYVDIQDRDIGSYVQDAQALVKAQLRLPPGYSLHWSGQYEYMLRAKARLLWVLPLTLGIIALLLYFAFGRMSQVGIILGTVPVALSGGLWLLWWQGYALSVAVAVGFIALAGVAVEIGVVMLSYLNQALAEQHRQAEDGRPLPPDRLLEAVREGAQRRLRPVLMTAVATIAGLLPIMFSTGTGSEVMRRIAAPMVGGMLSTLLLSLMVLPAVYLLSLRLSRTKE